MTKPYVQATPPLPQLLMRNAERFASQPATRIRNGEQWDLLTYAELAGHVRRVARVLVERGLQPHRTEDGQVIDGDRVALFAENRPEWSIADLAIQSAGGVVVPIFHGSSAEQVAHLLRDSGARTVFYSGKKAFQALAECGVAGLTLVALTSGTGHETLADLQPADEGSDAEVTRRTEALTLDNLYSITYTSGTTGLPRGAELQYRSAAHELDAIDTEYEIGPGDQSLAFLPLAHGLERIWTAYVLGRGALNTYCPDPRGIGELLPLAKPNLFISVPKLYEKVYAAAQERVGKRGIKRLILRWAMRVGGRIQHLSRKGVTPPAYWRIQLPLADRLVLRSIREAVGGPKKVLISGGAPLRREVEEFFSAAGLLLGQGYGLTETGPMMTYFGPATFKLGTVGYVIPGSEIRLGMDGELLCRGPNLMRGYWNNPEATAQAVDENGWFHTGDVGYIDNQGYVVITDRLKDLIITSGGKNVAPAPIEGLVLSDPLFEYAMVLGDNRPYLTLLAQPSLQHLEALATSMQVGFKNVEDLVTNPQIKEEVRNRVEAITARLPGYEQIRDVILTARGISVDEGTITPTLKVKRKVVEEKFAEQIEAMYSQAKDKKYH